MSKKRILLIEDDLFLQKTISYKLEKEGYEMVLASDGREGLKIATTEQFDLIITDIMLPFVSGLEILAKIKTELQITCPVIILTSAGNENAVVEGFRLGAEDYIKKPFSPVELTLRINRILQK